MIRSLLYIAFWTALRYNSRECYIRLKANEKPFKVALIAVTLSLIHICSVVVPGSYRKQCPAGEYSITCALIIGQRKESTDKKTSLNDALRDFGVSV